MLNSAQRIALGTLLMLLALVAAHADPVCPVPKDLSDEDKSSVLALAQQLGMAQPARVCGGFFPSASAGCPAIRVESTPMVAGPHRTWQTMWLVQRSPKDGPSCAWWPPGTEVAHAGDWVIGAEGLGVDQAWRVELQSGPIDVHLNYVVYGEAVRLLHAIDEGKLLDEHLAPVAQTEAQRRWVTELFAHAKITVSPDGKTQDGYLVWGIDDFGGRGMELRDSNGHVQLLHVRSLNY